MSREPITFCPQPFTFLGQGGKEFLTCCPGWIHPSRMLPNKSTDLWAIWNDPVLVELRQALLDGDFRFCMKCPARFGKPLRDKPLPSDLPIMEEPPFTYQILYDFTCNLHCPTCRSVPMATKQRPPGVLSPLQVLEQFPTLKTMAMSCSGDPFVSKDCLEFMHTPGDTKLILWTNGLLVPRGWQHIQRKVTVLLMSIDAATKETYEVVRAPGKWEQLQAAIQFVGERVEQGEIDLFQTNFVVQQANFREMPEFVRMSKRHHAHKVQFCTVAPWMHMSEEVWSRMNIFNPQHPEHGDLLRVLEDSVLYEPGVDSGLISEATRTYYGQLTTRDDHMGEVLRSTW